MAKNKNIEKELDKELKKERNKIYSVGGESNNYKRVIIIIGVVLVVLLLFYLITVLITKNDSDSSVSNTSNTTSSTSSISYEDIPIGRSFDMEDGEYLVLYYDKSNSDLSSTYGTLVSTYKSLDKHLDLYTVDMSNGFNSSYSSDSSNSNPSSLDDLKINGPTLIKFNNGSVSDYIEGEDKIKDYLS